MKNNPTDNSKEQAPQWLQRFFPFISILLGGAVLWYSWYRYQDMGEENPGFPGSEWLKLGLLAIIGVVLLTAAVLHAAGSSSGWPVFRTGLYLIPVMLMINLVILLVSVVYNIFQGKAQPLLKQVFTEPRNLIIPIVVIAVAVLGSLDKRKSVE
ncbi:MAG: hypothetical protein K0R57_2761 [Paenibacillaceae bacterium]|nr:hypothetical protein [Paenibacillaceae bacterium]